MVTDFGAAWVFLTYRLPRQPSAPRLALWRAVRRLGALQLADGLVALPHSDRNLEHLQWLAAEIAEHDGTAAVWHARSDSRHEHDAHVAAIRGAIDEEYEAILRQAEAAAPAGGVPDHRRTVRRLRAELRRVAARDYFEAPTGLEARAAVDRLAREVEGVPA